MESPGVPGIPGRPTWPGVPGTPGPPFDPSLPDRPGVPFIRDTENYTTSFKKSMTFRNSHAHSIEVRHGFMNEG